MSSPLRVLIAGGGIGGLAAALAAARAGQRVQVFEKSAVFNEIGAGLQLGPNATRILHAWGLGDALARAACAPECLQVMDAASGRLLGELPLGEAMQRRYGAPYLTLHRAALHQLLLQAVREQDGLELHTGWALQGSQQDDEGVHTDWLAGDELVGKAGPAKATRPVRHGDVLIAAHGLWSLPMAKHSHATGLRFMRHWAWRSLLDAAALPADLGPQWLRQVSLWLGPQMHAVAYPVRDLQGALRLNLVVIVQDDDQPLAGSWGGERLKDSGQITNLAAHKQLSKLLQIPTAAGPGWQRWPLFALPPLGNAQAMASGRIARLGDAAHPMPPYLAQGAAMAIEDAAALGACLANANQHPEDRLGAYAAQRWRRNAQVQARALRNARIFHASGPLRMARDAAMRLAGPQLLDQPWLYGGA